MNYGMKTSGMNDLQALSNRAGAKITGAIQKASAKTGVGFSYLLQQANVESSFKADAKAKTSSATGLYQFTKSTWLETVRDHGAEHGLGKYASQISADGTVANKAVRNQILALRNNPEIASAMAAEYASDNKQYLESTVGGEIGSTELYMAHFMGPGGAAKFLSKMQDNPNAIGAKSFSQAACSNEAVFYKENGKARTLSEIYAFFDKKFQGSGDVAPAVATPKTEYAGLGDNAKAAIASGKYTSGRASIFDESTGSWFTTSNPKTVKWANTQMATASNGSIPGLHNILSNPVDIMQIMEIATLHNDPTRYNS